MSMGSSRQQQTSQLDPVIRDAYLGNLQRSTGISEGLQARQFADFTPDQQAGFSLTRQFADPNSIGMQRVSQGAQAVAGVAGYQPQMVTGQQASRGGVRDVSATTGAENMQAYFNPFQQEVIDYALSDIERARQAQGLTDRSRAIAAGAFGGSRQGVAEALTNEAAIRETGRTAAGLRSQGFEFAAGMGQTDAARQLQAQAANQGVDLSLEQANAQLRQQALLSNQQAGLQGAGLNLQAGSQLADIGALTQNLGFTQAAQLAQIGQQQQAATQAQLDAIRNLPLEQQQIINAALNLTPAGGAGTVSQGTGSSRQFSLIG
jgi:hypothetical protein